MGSREQRFQQRKESEAFSEQRQREVLDDRCAAEAWRVTRSVVSRREGPGSILGEKKGVDTISDSLNM